MRCRVDADDRVLVERAFKVPGKPVHIAVVFCLEIQLDVAAVVGPRLGAVRWVWVIEFEHFLDLRKRANVVQHDHKRCLQLLGGVCGSVDKMARDTGSTYVWAVSPSTSLP